ncbi:MAG TPA: CRISPR system precrRNA processing endoribonuclease RAMP protein Cas6 [Longimicrobiaceae bacterium]|nr:CRISPR system precrRNA processing endoribonuclease RAMP protein Cas6 [Longimicrobiaceae bacterium]
METADRSVRRAEVPRFSRRQGRQMKVGGWMGEVVYAGDLAPWRTLLRVAELLNVGKQSTSSLGEVRLAR